jgi:hypothetical protein
MNAATETDQRHTTLPELDFSIEGVEPQRFAATPTLAFHLRVSSSDPAQLVHNVLLQSQIQIESTRRRYSHDEQTRLVDLFGAPSRWSQTLRSMLWTHAGTTVAPFQGSTLAKLHVPCTFDFNVAATKYFAGLEDGLIPLLFLFSGSIFYAAGDGALNVARIGWEKEARFSLPCCVWKEMMDHYYPGTAWLCVERETFEKLHAYKRSRGATTWEEAICELLSFEDREAQRGPLTAREATG